ncbi:MAG: hypothetical protein IPO09_09880 [Anaeromyxobacter sp.]|nr:hypothetical protein [Anaeromyxobacter sp.]MBL0278579.1 hypothetical protein [Anaeromyxobacter sp.]
MSPGCGHGAAALALVEGVVRETAPGAEVVTVMVGTLEDAERLAFPGSPTIRVHGLDVDPRPPGDVGLG